MPDTITISKADPIYKGKYYFYNKVVGATQSSYLNNFNVAVNGQSVTALLRGPRPVSGQGLPHEGGRVQTKEHVHVGG